MSMHESLVASALAYFESKCGKACHLATTAPHLRRLVVRTDRPEMARKPGPPSAVVTAAKEERIRRDRAAGATLPELAARYRTSYRRIYQILKGADDAS